MSTMEKIVENNWFKNITTKRTIFEICFVKQNDLSH